MRNKRLIAGIIAFIGTFAVSVGLVWLLFGFPAKPTYTYIYSRHNCSERHESAIYSLLQRDINNGRERDMRSFRTVDWEDTGNSRYSIKNHADSVAGYVNYSSSMDTSDLPQDFQIAWQKHMNAWRDYSNYLNDLKESSADSEMNEDGFEASENRYTNEINRTWYEVLRIGRTYGAYIE